MPEGDSLRRAADRLSVLEGQVVSVDTPHPRAAALGIAPRLDGKRLLRAEAVGKNLLLTFDDGTVLRSHLGMRGRWQVQPARAKRSGSPWLVIRGEAHEAVLWHGPVLELGRGAVARLGPDILDEPLDLEEIVRRLRRADPAREIGDALLDQRVVAGIGNVWRAETLFLAGISPWTQLADLEDEDLQRTVATAARAMHTGRRPRWVYRRSGLPCRRCGARIAARRQGDGARTAYWCPACQGGTGAASA